MNTKNKYFTCILPTGGDTTKNILMVAWRKSSLFALLSMLPFGLAPPFVLLLLLLLLHLKLILCDLSLSFDLSLFRTPLLEVVIKEGIEAGFWCCCCCLEVLTTSTFLTEALLVLSLKDNALKYSPVLEIDPSILFCRRSLVWEVVSTLTSFEVSDESSRLFSFLNKSNRAFCKSKKGNCLFYCVWLNHISMDDANNLI